MVSVKKVIGKKIRSVALLNDREGFCIFFDDDTTARFRVEGDCCSHSWIEHLDVPNDVSGAEIISVDEKTIDAVNSSKYDYLQVYETRFRTSRGDVVLEFRNSSNGYYGGYLVLDSIS